MAATISKPPRRGTRRDRAPEERPGYRCAVRALHLALAAIALSGCYRINGLGDAGPIDAFQHDAFMAPRDAGSDGPPVPWMDAPSPGTDAPLVPDDVGTCLCVSDADCPPPPPSWNCLVPVCAACACSLVREPARCGPGASCDPAGSCFALASDAGPDAFVTRPDAFVSRPDAGSLDAFVVPIDAPFVPVDAFVSRPDASSPDAGRPPSSDALRFTTGQVLTVPDRPALSIGPELTLELWVRLRSAGIIAIKGDTSSGSHLYLEARPMDADGVFRTFWLGWSFTGTRVIVELDRDVRPDTWTHFAIVQRQNAAGRVEISVYIDGDEVGRGPFDAGEVMSYLGSFNSAPFTLGRTEMDVDEVRLWRVARGQAAIRGFMRSELMPGVSGLVAYWPLDGVGQVVLDRSLNGNDGFRGSSPAEDSADPTWIADGAF
jgi:hypothetical protein